MQLNLNIKKRIAKEILYFFSTVVILFLVWGGIELRNSYLINKIQGYQSGISSLSNTIDSLQNTFNKKIITFDELVGEKAAIKPPPPSPQAYFSDKKNKWEKYRVTDEEFPILKKGHKKNNTWTPPNDGIVVESNKEPSKEVDVNSLIDDPLHILGLPPTSELYAYLRKNRFDFNSIVSPPLPKGYTIIPDYDLFEKDIKDEFGIINKTSIEIIYSFIKSNDTSFKATFASFSCCLMELPEPPPHDVWEQSVQLNRTKTETNEALVEIKNELLYKNDIINIMGGCSIFAFGLLYPVRLIFYLLQWALRTVRKKEDGV